MLLTALRRGLFGLCAMPLVGVQAQTWNGGGANNNWAIATNWSGGSAPANNGSASVVFSGSIRTSPNLDQNWSVSSVTFGSGASAFSLGAAGGATLSIGSGGIANNSANLQTISLPLFLGSSQTWNTGSADLLVSGSVSSNWITLTKSGSGTVTLSGANAGLQGTLAVSAGTVVAASSSALGPASYGNAVSPGGTLALQGGITLTEGDLTIAGAGAASGGALRNNSGANTLAADLKLSADSSVVSAAGTLSLANTLDTGGHVLSLSGAGDIVVARNINGGGSLAVSGSGSRTFNGAQINVSGITLSGSGSVTASSQLNLGGGNLVVSGSGPVSLTGSAINVGNVVVSGSGAVNLSTAINASGSFTQTGSGTTTFSGSGTNYFSSVSITGGAIVLDKDSGYALQAGSGNVVISGATVSFGADNQIANWNDVTLGDGAVLQLNNTTQAIDQLTITGNSILDFGSSGSSFDINNLTLAGNSVLTIVNWSSSLDSFYANFDPGSSSLAKIVFDGLGEAAWNSNSGNGVLVPTVPVPEPAATGRFVLGTALAWPWIRRRRRPTPAA